MGDETLEALWKNVLDKWEEDRAHSAFLSYCRETEQLAEAAARYKGMTGDRERGESAKKRLSGIAVLAIAQLEATRTKGPQAKKQAWSLLAIAIFVGLTGALLAYLIAT